MHRDGPDRRRAARRAPQPDETLARVRLRTGRELTVVNISPSGALVEGLTRLLPGTHADIHVVTRHGRVLVRTRVVRALVWRLQADVVCYRTALAFDTPVDTESGFAQAGPGESNGLALSEQRESNGLALSEQSESNGYSIPAKIPGDHESQGIPYPNANVHTRVRPGKSSVPLDMPRV